ncbi:MAG: MFS transporter [Synechococcus sp.]
MLQFRAVLPLTFADFIVRSAYQMGKSPLLPIFAASLGASDVSLGLIVSISTCTGMILKPLVGAFSDIFGRRLWILLGTSFFAIVPFAYQFVHTPFQLAIVRIVHGLATAIYGPVTLAYISQKSPKYLAERIGWFSIARSAGYIVGPLTASWLLLSFSPSNIYIITGILSITAFFPALSLSDAVPVKVKPNISVSRQVLQTLHLGGRSPFVWLAGSLQAMMYVALYAVKAFLPVYALSLQISIGVVGALFSIQELTHLIFKPWAGRIGDLKGYFLPVSIGLILLGLALPLVVSAQNYLYLLVAFILMGFAQALIAPSMMALVVKWTDRNSLGATLGLVGTLNNAGKVAGPICAGILIHWLQFSIAFQVIGSSLLLVALGLFIGNKFYVPNVDV